MTDNFVTMTRQTTARQNIESSIHLLIRHEALASANLLAWAAIDVLHGVAKLTDMETTLAMIDRTLIPGKEAAWYRRLKEHYNYAKHADKDPEKHLEFNYELVEIAVFVAVTDYQAIYRTVSIPMAMILHWVFLKKPEILNGGIHPDFSASKSLFGASPKFTDLKRLYDTYLENRSILQSMAQEVCPGELEY